MLTFLDMKTSMYGIKNTTGWNFKKIFLEYNCFTMLSYSLLYIKVSQLYVYTYCFFLDFLPI